MRSRALSVTALLRKLVLTARRPPALLVTTIVTSSFSPSTPAMVWKMFIVIMINRLWVVCRSHWRLSSTFSSLARTSAVWHGTPSELVYLTSRSRPVTSTMSPLSMLSRSIPSFSHAVTLCQVVSITGLPLRSLKQWFVATLTRATRVSATLVTLHEPTNPLNWILFSISIFSISL